MKADYTRLIKTISGRVGDFVHVRLKATDEACIKRYVKPKIGENNHQFGNSIKNIAAIWKQCSEPFKNDLKIYAEQRREFYSGEEIPAYSNYAHFIRFLYSYQKEFSEIDLAAASKEELETAGISTSVKEIVEQGFLPPILDATTLNNNW